MVDILINDWMDEFESLTESEIHTYSVEQEHNHEVMMALYKFLAEPCKIKGPNLIDGICRQLLDFYRSGEEQLRKFTLQYIPALVVLHLTDSTYTSVQTLLVTLYNLEITDSKGQPRITSFRIPSIAQSSIYHDSTNLESAFIAENSLRRWEECNSKLVSWGPLPQIECFNAQNRQRVITALVFLYNQQLASVCTQGIEYTCKGISKLVSQGFSANDSSRSSIHSDCSCNQILMNRIPVSSPLLLEFLHIIYHGAERGVNGAVHTLNDIIQRSMYEAYSDVLLAANAIKNLLQHSPSISVTPRPSHTHAISKSMITNASFRTKKLPDDIPIQDDQHNQSEVPLDSISEEQESGEGEKIKTRGSVSALKHLPKLPGLGKKHKNKNLPGDQTMEMTSGGGSGDLITDTSTIELNNTVHVSAV